MTLLRSKPLRQQSPKAKERAQRLASVKKALLARAGYQSECCGRRDVRLEHHHVFSRHGLGAWNDSAECGAVLCPEHHRRLTDEQEPELKARLMWDAVDNLAARLAHETGRVVVVNRPRSSAWGRAADLVDRLEAAGVEP